MTPLSHPAYGVIFHPAFPPETLPDYARRAEAAGFDELWLWDDCFMPGALTSAAIALASTTRIRVCIGLMPATAYNPLFVAMELTTLARVFPGRILPGFGHGVSSWMTQIGAAPPSSLKSLAETVTAVRRLMAGELVTIEGTQVRLDQVQMQITPQSALPLYVGAMREKSLRLAGRLGDGTILTGMSSPAYVRWALGHIRAGMAEAGSTDHRVVVYVETKVGTDGEASRALARRSLSELWPWADCHIQALGIVAEVDAFGAAHGREGIAERMPDPWLDAFAAAGTCDQVVAALDRLAAAGADSVVLQPLKGDPACLDEYAEYLMPRLRRPSEAIVPRPLVGGAPRASG